MGDKFDTWPVHFGVPCSAGASSKLDIHPNCIHVCVIIYIHIYIYIQYTHYTSLYWRYHSWHTAHLPIPRCSVPFHEPKFVVWATNKCWFHQVRLGCVRYGWILYLRFLGYIINPLKSLKCHQNHDIKIHKDPRRKPKIWCNKIP